jgi:hypothetical protein
MYRKSNDQKVREIPYKPTIELGMDLYINRPIYNSFGYTTGLMITLLNKHGLVCVISSDIVNEILQYMFWRCLICNDHVSIQNTECSLLCLLKTNYNMTNTIYIYI